MGSTPTPLPAATLAANNSTQSNLDNALGTTVAQFCGKYGTVGDDVNHCAHFIGHLLSLRIPGAALCSNVGGSSYTYQERHNGYCVRVNEVFNSCTGRGRWEDTVPAGTPRFVVATVAGNILRESPLTIGTMSRKHIGIYLNGMVYHYSNTKDKVVKVTIGEFKHHYGRATILLKANLP
jgi:hypothetical protein